VSQEKWITRIRHKGYMMPRISVREIVETDQYRKLLECFAAERAAQMASTEQLAKLAKLIEAEQQKRVCMTDILAANNAFHIGLVEIARNQRVLHELKSTLGYMHRLDFLSTQVETR
jgi:DNA-binding GntR family transcriptional regulator